MGADAVEQRVHNQGSDCALGLAAPLVGVAAEQIQAVPLRADSSASGLAYSAG